MMDREIEIRPLADGKTASDFLDVPHIVYRDDPEWVAPLRFVEEDRISPAKHPFYEYGKGAFWVAYRNGEPVGRIGALVNSLHLQKYADATGHFSMLEAIDDRAVFAALMKTAEDWLGQRGLTRMLGPANLTINEEYGLLVDGFDTPPFTLMGHARPYYLGHLEALGFGKAKDLFAFRGPATAMRDGAQIPRLERYAQARGVTFRTSRRLKMMADLKAMFELYSRAWEGNWGSVPMTAKEIRHAVTMFWGLLAPGLLVLAEKDGRLVGALVVFPNINECISDLGGRLLPFGWLKALWRLKITYPKSARLVIAGVDTDLQSTPLGGAIPLILLSKVRSAQRKYGTKTVEGSWVLEDNLAIIAYMDKAGFQPYKTYRILEKTIAAVS